MYGVFFVFGMKTHNYVKIEINELTLAPNLVKRGKEK